MIADPGCILSTISLSINIGAGLSGINAVEIIISMLLIVSLISSACFFL